MNKTLLQKKICLLGSFAVGKTSLIRRFVDDRFDDKYLSTVGVTISRKEVHITEEMMINMIIWDLAGKEDYDGKQASYLLGAAGAFLVADLSRPETFSILRKYKETLIKTSPRIKIILLGNKVDLLLDPQRETHPLAEELDTPCFLTSAKDGRNVEEAFLNLAKKLIE